MAQTFERIRLLLLGCGLLLLATAESSGQARLDSASSVLQIDRPTDSTSTAFDYDATFYEIELLRLENWIIENTEKFADLVLLKEVAKLKKEAEGFAEDGDYSLALIWIETIWDVLFRDNDSFANDAIDPEYANGFDIGDLETKRTNFTWSKEIIMGVDLWSHEFSFSVPNLEGLDMTSFRSDGGNPFTGFRMSFDHGRSLRNAFQGYALFKYSRDYLSGELELRSLKPIGQDSYWKVLNRFSGNSFYRDSDLRYFQNQTALSFNFRGLGAFSLDLEDEFLIRRYANEVGTYPNYFNNIFKGFLRAHLNSRSTIGAGYRNVMRSHPNFEINDYREHRIDFNWYQIFGKDGRFVLDNELRFRDYVNVDVDTFFQDYTEDYLRAELLLPFSQKLGLELEGDLIKRDYALRSGNSLPDYLEWEIEPELYFKITPEWRISGGMVYRSLTHEQLISQLSSVDASFDAALGVTFEDYYAYGPTVSLELFKFSGMMLSLQETFLIQRHPNSRSRSSAVVDIYPDSYINSILLFFSWNVSKRWRFSALANIDDERSRQDNHTDSQNTIVGLEIDYIF